jgi:hypothetical protein
MAGGRDDMPQPSFDRRQLLVAGGVSAALIALVAACAETTDEIPVSGQVDQPNKLTQPPVTNAVYLRTSSSLVHNAIDSYGQLLDLGALDADDEELVRFILDQQTEHARLLEEATTVAGGESFGEPNPSVATKIVEPALAAINDSPEQAQDVLRYVNAFETLIGATLQGYVPNLSEAQPRELMMRIAAVDNRHSAVVTSRIVDFAVLAPEVLPGETAATTTTLPATTTTSPGASAAPPPAAPLPVYQVPGPFASLAAVEVVLGGIDFTWETPGPNSYVYEESPTTSP